MTSRRTPWKALLLGIAVTLPALVALAQEGASLQEVKWRRDYYSARMEAKEKGLPLVIDFGTRSCFFCTKLDQTTFRDTKVTAVMNERFIPLKVNADGTPGEIALANALSITSYPTIVLADPDGNLLSAPLVGYKEAGEFHECLQRALASITSPDWMLRDLQLAAKAIEAGNYARAIPALRTILDDGKVCQAQVNADKLMNEMEQKAGDRLLKARQLQEKAQYAEAIEALRDTMRVFPGLAPPRRPPSR